mgnify:CR=1 FL=1
MKSLDHLYGIVFSMSVKASRRDVRYFASNIAVVVGIVLVWRGIWYLLDAVDYFFLHNNHIPLAILGIIVGICILYFPDKDLKELGKL